MPSLNIQSKNKEQSSIDRAVNMLSEEAKLLFEVLDSASSSIRQLESSLKTLMANFPFRLKIEEEAPSPYKSLEERHHEQQQFNGTYCTQVCWYIAWEAEDDSKNFRLFLISEEKEIVDCDYPREFDSKQLFKKPIIETDLATRFKYVGYLESFIDAFTEYLKKYRVSIQGLPF